MVYLDTCIRLFSFLVFDVSILYVLCCNFKQPVQAEMDHKPYKHTWKTFLFYNVFEFLKRK